MNGDGDGDCMSDTVQRAVLAARASANEAHGGILAQGETQVSNGLQPSRTGRYF